MIQNIVIKLPKSQALWDRTFSKDFMALFGSCTNIMKKSGTDLEFGHEGMFPKTRVLVNQSTTAISFEDISLSSLSYCSKGLVFGFNLTNSVEYPKTDRKVTTRTDAAGEYCEVVLKGKTYYQLTMAQLLARFEGKLKELNHTGINIPSSDIPAKEYKSFKNQLAAHSFVTRYPTGEEWPFLIPCTPSEFVSGVDDLETNRNPKFEVVYDSYNTVPHIQFDVETTLTKPRGARIASSTLWYKPWGIGKYNSHCVHSL